MWRSPPPADVCKRFFVCKRRGKMKDRCNGKFEVKLGIDRGYEMMVMHLMDAEAIEEAALCEATVGTLELVSAQYYVERYYLEQPVAGVSAPSVCEACKAFAVSWVEDCCRTLDVEVAALRAKAERLRGKGAARYRNSIVEAKTEADRLEDEVGEYRRVADQLAKEAGAESGKG